MNFQEYLTERKKKIPVYVLTHNDEIYPYEVEIDNVIPETVWPEIIAKQVQKDNKVKWEINNIKTENGTTEIDILFPATVFDGMYFETIYYGKKALSSAKLQKKLNDEG